MRAGHRFAVSSLATIFAVVVVHAQAPAEGEEQESASDLDEIAAEEFVRDLREEAETAREKTTQENDVECTEPCTSVAELLALIQSGPLSAEAEPDDDNSDLSAEGSEDEGAPNR